MEFLLSIYNWEFSFKTLITKQVHFSFHTVTPYKQTESIDFIVKYSFRGKEI